MSLCRGGTNVFPHELTDVGWGVQGLDKVSSPVSTLDGSGGSIPSDDGKHSEGCYDAVVLPDPPTSPLSADGMSVCSPPSRPIGKLVSEAWL
jgi:hypothetical protein